MKKEDRVALSRLVSEYGASELMANISHEDRSEGLSLTIVANLGLHPLPKDILRGDIYVASEGNLNFGDELAVTNTIISVLEKLKIKLVEKRWNKIYLLPFGHSVLSMNIKMAVYRTLRIETIDYFYHGEGRYSDIEIDTRSVMLDQTGGKAAV